MLAELNDGNRTVLDAMLPRVYDELRAMARRQLRGERANRAHFLGVAALSMRRILLNYARDRAAQKRGGGAPLATFEDGMAPRTVRVEELIDLDDALDRLEALHERQSQVVTYRFFGGLTHREIAEVLGVSEPTVRRDWRLARAWLSRELRASSAG